jgi:hypothetical protein
VAGPPQASARPGRRTRERPDALGARFGRLAQSKRSSRGATRGDARSECLLVVSGRGPTNGRRLAIGSLIGAAGGLSAGGLAAYALAGGVSGDPNYNAAPPILIGVAVGATVGGLIGHATRGPAWTEVPLDRVRVSILPTRRRGIDVAVAIRF